MNNLVLLCPFHHRAVHEGGWTGERIDWGYAMACLWRERGEATPSSDCRMGRTTAFRPPPP